MIVSNVLARMIHRPMRSRRGSRSGLGRGWRHRSLLLEALEDRLCPSSWTSIGPYGSSTFGVVIDPGHPETLYTHSDGAGVRMSTDGGATWSPKNIGHPLYVHSLLLDPMQPLMVFAGTNGGAYKSTDGGQSWTQILPGGVYLLAMAPTDSNILYAQGTLGAFSKTTNGGMTWQQTGDGLVGAANSIVVDPLHADTVYVGTQGTNAFDILGEGVFKSTDGGGHFTKVLASTTGLSLALDPGDPQIVYAGNADGVFKSYDGGDTWFQPIGFHPDAIASLVVDPSDPHTVYAGTLDGGVFQSTDGAATWHGSGLSTELILSLAVDPTDSDTVYAGTSTGPYVSHDAGASWSPLDDDLRTNCACYGTEGVTVAPTDSKVIYMNTTSGGGFVTRDGGASWSPVTAGFASANPRDITFDPHDPNIVFWGSGAWFGPGGLFKSTDGGRTWYRTSLGPKGIYVWSLGEDPNDSNTIYAGTFVYGLYKSTDAGDSWKPVNTGQTNLEIDCILVDPRDSKIVYVGTDSGLLKSTDGGENWSRIGFDDTVINSLSLDPENSILYAGMGRNGSSHGLWKSMDGGINWTNILLLPNLIISPAHGILIDPTHPNTVYVSARVEGVFMSTDYGENWTPINEGLTDQDVFGMAMDPQEPRTIYAGTQTRSVFVLHVGANPGQPGRSGASGRRAGKALPKHSLTAGALLTGSRIVSVPWQPNVMAPTDGALPGPLASPRLLDPLFAATAREEPVRAVSEVRPVRHAAASESRWQPLLTEFDLLE